MPNWFAEQRLAFIDEMLRVYRFINRDHLVRKFYISIPQASHDLRVFQAENPGRVVYNKSLKRYEAA